jgi:hypothetical protein
MRIRGDDKINLRHGILGEVITPVVHKLLDLIPRGLDGTRAIQGKKDCEYKVLVSFLIPLARRHDGGCLVDKALLMNL